MAVYLKAEVQSLYSDADVLNAAQKYPNAAPFTKESLWYRDIYEEFYPGRSDLVKDFWMSNKSW